MFSKGDKVVYPLYGAGIIEELQHSVVDGRDQTSYVMKLPLGNLRIMVSAAKAESVGVRSVMDGGELMDIIGSVQPIPMPENWNQRYKENMERIKSGSVDVVAGVFRALRERERTRGLSSAEKKVLSAAKQIILSEIILSHDTDKPGAEEMLEKAIY